MTVQKTTGKTKLKITLNAVKKTMGFTKKRKDETKDPQESEP